MGFDPSQFVILGSGPEMKEWGPHEGSFKSQPKVTCRSVQTPNPRHLEPAKRAVLSMMARCTTTVVSTVHGSWSAHALTPHHQISTGLNIQSIHRRRRPQDNGGIQGPQIANLRFGNTGFSFVATITILVESFYKPLH